MAKVKVSDGQFNLIALAFGIPSDDAGRDELRTYLEKNPKALKEAVRYSINKWGVATPLPADTRGWEVYHGRINSLRELITE